MENELLRQSLNSLQQAAEQYQQDGGGQARDYCVQRFESAFDRATGVLTQLLGEDFPQQIELGVASGLLLNGWKQWNRYRQARRLACEKELPAEWDIKAEMIIANVPGFLTDARYLLKQTAEPMQPQLATA
ncbi:hypothetical protein [Oceanobacter mangrovi]|uniref:hypothetical protein n=1 Tax=Oceanobacter mangrovi TaxID=2862510 RepID=UPI001C8D2899|nr:hypothetical protein [Oceanobacter mangrovi]